MRKTWIIAMAAAVAALAGCSRETAFEAPLSRTLRAGFEVPTRVAFSDEGVFSWKEGDVIGVPYTKADNSAARMDFTLMNGAGAAQAEFTTTEDVSLLAADAFAVVPATALDVANADAPIKLPASYTWAEGQSNAVMVATGLNLSGTNTFKHVGGIVKVTYKDIPAEADGFMLSSDAGICGSFALQDGVIVAGPTANYVKVSFTAGTASEMAFYVPVPTGEYKLTASLTHDGFSIPGTKKETSAPVKIARKTLLLMDALTSQTSEPVTVTISTAEDLKSFLADADQLGRGSKMILAANIDAGTITPAEAFYGDVDGKGFKITYQEELPEGGSDSYSGLFGYIDGSVKNLKVAGSIKTGTIKNAGIAGQSAPNTLFENCESDVDIRMEVYGAATPKFAGIVAVAGDGTTIKGCKNTGDLAYALPDKPTGRSTQIGGIVANVSNHADVINCVNEGELRYEALGTPRIGGMIGYLNDPVNIVLTSCVNRGHIVSDINWTSGYVYIGGITGYVGTNVDPALPLERVLYMNCANYGKVESLGVATLCTRAGGIASYVGMTDTKMTAAGLADSGQLYEFRDCKNFGEILTTGETAKKEVLGGIVGFGEKVAKVVCTDCVNNAPLSGVTTSTNSNSVYAGGIIGGTCGLQSTLTGCVIGPETVISGGAKSVLGLICGNNAKYTTDITGKVAGGKIVKGTTETVATADNFQTLLCKAIDGTTTGVVFESGDIPALTEKNRQTDSLALVAIYNAAGGDSGWKADRRWDLSKPMDGENKWYGVTVTDGRVTALKLLKGTITADWTIPDALADLTELTDLRFIDCKVNGSIPDAVYSLYKLETLYLTNNKVSGTLSPKIGQLRALTNVYIDQNFDLGGPLPEEIGQLTQLVNLNISKTGFSGTVPESIKNLDALKNFMAFTTKLSGNAPDFWDELASLELVQLYDIPTMGGPLPESFGRCTKLKNIYMYSCNFEGNIPESWANLPTTMVNVRIYDNKLTGVVPAAIQNHPKWSAWKPEQYILPQQEGYGLTLQ